MTGKCGVCNHNLNILMFDGITVDRISGQQQTVRKGVLACKRCDRVDLMPRYR